MSITLIPSTRGLDKGVNLSIQCVSPLGPTTLLKVNCFFEADT